MFLLLLILIGLLIAYLLVFFKFGYVDIDNNVCLVEKTALITGGSSGIGYQIALSLASRGCKIIIADKVVNEGLKSSLVEETNNQNISLEYVDFASFTSVRNLAKRLKQSEEKLDILINNVGIGKAPETPSEDGLNLTMQINYYSPFLLTHLLLDLMKKSDSARIIFTSSVASFFHNMTPEFVTTNSIKVPRYRMHDYTNAKFLTVVSSDIFAAKLKKFNITCNTYHPGVAKTNFFKNTRENLNTFSFTDIWAYVQIHLLRILVGVPAHKAARPGINLATSKKFKNVTGIFFGKYLPNIKPKYAENKIFCNKIWKATEIIVKLKPEEVLD